MLAAVFAFLPAFYAGSQDGSSFAEGSFVFFAAMLRLF